MALAALFILLLTVGACTTLADVMKAKADGEGTSQIYPVDKDQAFEIAMTVFHWEGSDAIEEHRSQGYMLTTTSYGYSMSAGTNMGAWIESQEPGQTKVTVITMRRYQLDLITGLTETTFHRRFGQAVEIIKAGKPLPLVPPPLTPTR